MLRACECLVFRLSLLSFTLFYIRLLAVVSLPCAFGYLQVCEDGGEGGFLGRAGIDAELNFLGCGIHVAYAHLAEVYVTFRDHFYSSYNSGERYFISGATMRDCIISLFFSRFQTSSRVRRWTSNSSVASRCCSDFFSTPVARKQCVRFVIVPGFAESTISSFHSPPP